VARSTVCDVVWQPGQFSYTQDGKSERMTELPAIQKAVDIALAVSRGKRRDVTGGALHYWNPNLARPAWGKGAYKVLISEHVFARLAGR